jgi:hypothetical protein
VGHALALWCCLSQSACLRAGAQTGGETPKAAIPAATPSSPAPSTPSCGVCASPRYCWRGECVVPGSIVASAKRGSGRTDIGLVDMDEGDSEAPNSLVVTEADKRVYVLDQVNSRIQVFRAGKYERAIPLPAPMTIEDMGLLPNGQLALVTQYKSTFFVIDKDGAVLQQVPFASVGVPSASLLWLQGTVDGLYRDTGSELTLQFDREGNVVGSGATVHASATSPDGAWWVKLATHEPERLAFSYGARGAAEGRLFEFLVDKPSRPDTLGALAIDLDAQGNVYVLTEAIWGKAPKPLKRRTYLSVWSPELVELRRLSLPGTDPDHQPHRYGFLTPEGFFYYLDISKQRICVRRY